MYEVRAGLSYDDGMVVSFGEGENPPKTPDFWGVYDRDSEGCLEHIADFTSKAAAESYVNKLYDSVAERVYNSLAAFQSKESAIRDAGTELSEKEFDRILKSVLRKARQRVFDRPEAERVIKRCKELLKH